MRYQDLKKLIGKIKNNSTQKKMITHLAYLKILKELNIQYMKGGND
jgi:hypothetical protein